MKKIINKIVLSIVALALFATPVTTFAAPGDIVDTAINTPGLESLVDSVAAADLAGALSEPNGPFTVFAPTNEAFASLPKWVSKALENDPDLLGKILLYHVVPGKIMSSDVPRFTRVETLQGSDLYATNRKGHVRVNFSNVVIPDVEVSNGVVHVIDRVIIPWREVLKSIRDNRNMDDDDDEEDDD